MPGSVIEKVEWGLVALGVILWIVALMRGRALEWFGSRSQLPLWHIAPSEFLAFGAAFLVAMYAGPMLAVTLFSLDLQVKPAPASTAIIIALTTQCVWLAVCAGFCAPRFLRPRGGEMAWAPAALAGLAAVLLYLPAGSAAGELWKIVLQRLDVSMELQESVRYLRNVGSVTEFFGWFLLVVVLAPLVEEWAFRRLLYRFLSAHLPEWFAIVASALVFAMFHPNAVSFLPLFTLGIALCLAYRYTGRFITPVIMHAAFNLNTLVYVVLSPAP